MECYVLVTMTMPTMTTAAEAGDLFLDSTYTQIYRSNAER